MDTLRQLAHLDAVLDRLDHALRRRYFLLVAGMVIIGIFLAKFELDSSNTATKAQLATSEIQQQRYDVALANCQETDARHTNTIDRILSTTAKFAKQQPARAAELRQSVGYTVFLVDALAPYTKDCAAKARALTQGAQRPSRSSPIHH